MEKHKCIYRKPKSLSLLSLIKTPVLSYLLQFLTTQECYEFKKVNITLYNAFYYLYGNWPLELYKIATTYHLKIAYNQIDMNRNQSVQKERIYPIRDHNGLFVQIREKKERIYALFNSISFCWSNDSRYWNQTCYPDSMLGGPSHTLLSVCWVDPKLTVYHVPPKNYNLYLRHGLKRLKPDELKVTISIDSQSILNQNYPTKEMKDEFKKEVETTWTNLNHIQNINLVDVLLCKINQTQFKPKENNEYEITVKFFQNNNWWKSGWIIDAFYLEEDSQ